MPDLARALVQTGFVVALPEHRGDNYKDASRPRPRQLEAAPGGSLTRYRRHRQDARWISGLKLDKVGVFGPKIHGGHTALSLAGAFGRLRAFWRIASPKFGIEDFNACVGTFTQLTGGWADGLKKFAALRAAGLAF